MWYLIHTDTHTRPYLTSLPFIAHDFLTWNHRVHTYPLDSPYIREIRLRENSQRATEWRVGILEIWAREVLSRTQREGERGSGPEPQDVRSGEEEAFLTHEEKRVCRASRLARDFLGGMVAFGECGCGVREFERGVERGRHAAFPVDTHPVPPGLIGVISKYMRLVRATRYSSNVPLPSWADPAIAHADQVTIEFNSHPAVEMKHLVHAMRRAVLQGTGRMGRVEQSKETGVFKVLLFVDVGDCVVVHGRAMEDEYTVDPVPVYQRGEGPPPYT